MASAALISWDQDIRSGLLHCLVEPDPAGRRKARAIPRGEEDSTAAALDPFQADANGAEHVCCGKVRIADPVHTQIRYVLDQTVSFPSYYQYDVVRPGYP